MTDLAPLNLHTHVDRIRASVAQAIDAAETGPDALMVLGAIQTVQAALRDLKALTEAKLIELIDRDGEFNVGNDTRWYVGVDRSYRPKDKAAVLEAILHVAGGDVGQLANLLNSDPFKPGAIRDTLTDDGTPELFDRLFTTVERKDAKTGKPKRVAKSTNPMLV